MSFIANSRSIAAQSAVTVMCNRIKFELTCLYMGSLHVNTHFNSHASVKEITKAIELHQRVRCDV